MVTNIQIDYLYRDASNYKRHGSVTVANPNRLSVKKVTDSLQDMLGDLSDWSDVLLFRPEWVGLKTVFLFEEFGRNEDDHDWHEINVVSETTSSADDPAERTIEELLRNIERTHKKA